MEHSSEIPRMESRSQSRLGLPILVTFYLLVAMSAAGDGLNAEGRRSPFRGSNRSSVSSGHQPGPSIGIGNHPRDRLGRGMGYWAWGFGAWWGSHWVFLHEGLVDPGPTLVKKLRNSHEDLTELRSIYPFFDPASLGFPGVRSFRLPAPRAPSV